MVLIFFFWIVAVVPAAVINAVDVISVHAVQNNFGVELCLSGYAYVSDYV